MVIPNAFSLPRSTGLNTQDNSMVDKIVQNTVVAAINNSLGMLFRLIIQAYLYHILIAHSSIGVYVKVFNTALKMKLSCGNFGSVEGHVSN